MRRLLIIAFVLTSADCGLTPAHAQPEPVDVKVEVTASTAVAPASVTATFTTEELDDAYGPLPASSAVASAPTVEQVIGAIEKASKATTQAIKSRDLPYWLLAISSLIWAGIAVARRFFGAFAQSKSARWAAAIAGVAAGTASLVIGGAQPWKAFVVALTGGGAIAQNEMMKMLGLDVSQPKGHTPKVKKAPNVFDPEFMPADTDPARPVPPPDDGPKS